MKNFIFLSAMAVAALSANAQAVESGLKAQPIGFQKTFAKMNVKGGELAPRLEGARTPMRAIADDAQAAIVNGVFYQRPEGCYYSAYTWGSARTHPCTCHLSQCLRKSCSCLLDHQRSGCF